MSECDSGGRSRWQAVGRRPVYSGRVRIVSHEVRLPSGAHDSFEVDESIPFAVAVLLQDRATEALLLTRQYRYPIDRWIFDLPGGAGEVGEAPEAAARRECEEELGLIPQTMSPLHTFFPNPGRAAWPVHLFFVDTTRPGTAATADEAEQVELAHVSVAELDRLVVAGTIVDPSLLIARTMAAATGLLPPVAGPTSSLQQAGPASRTASAGTAVIG
ncbi:NUDIX hydrolase [Amnibacterium endophyticum]|uniref:NUDIX hydrolase n=1 Tax=Amnibacterium endophyticum TaxID=2109337 RepID=A0ABW4LGG1_9MICO